MNRFETIHFPPQKEFFLVYDHDLDLEVACLDTKAEVDEYLAKREVVEVSHTTM